MIGKYQRKDSDVWEVLTVDILKEHADDYISAFIPYKLLIQHYFNAVYSGGHHRVWCNGDVHIKQTVNHRELPLDYYAYFHIDYVATCDCSSYEEKRLCISTKSKK